MKSPDRKIEGTGPKSSDRRIEGSPAAVETCKTLRPYPGGK